VTNLTDAELDEMHEKVWIFPFGRFTLRAIAELRELRAEVDILREFIAEVKAENEELRVENSNHQPCSCGWEEALTAINAELEAENERLWAENERLRGALRFLLPLVRDAFCVAYPAVCGSCDNECQLSAARSFAKDGDA